MCHRFEKISLSIVLLLMLFLFCEKDHLYTSNFYNCPSFSKCSDTEIAIYISQLINGLADMF